MSQKKFSMGDLVRTLVIALLGYLANSFGLVNLPAFY